MINQIVETNKVYNKLLKTIYNKYPYNDTERVVFAEEYLLNVILNYDQRGKSLEAKHVRGACGEVMFEVLINYYRNYFNNFKLYKNLILPLEDGGTTQLDFVILSPRSIIVVESKSLFGNITISEDDVKSTWYDNKGKEQERIFRPWKQNLLHIIALKKYLKANNVFMHNAVFMFGAGEIQTADLKMGNHLMSLNNTMSVLDNLMLNDREGQTIPIEQMKSIICLLESSIPTEREEVRHIQYLNSKYK